MGRGFESCVRRMFTAGLGLIFLLNFGGILHLISIARKDADRLREVALN